MKFDEDYYKFLRTAYEQQKKSLKTWKQLCKDYKEKYGEDLTDDALRGRATRVAVGKSYHGTSNSFKEKESTQPSQFMQQNSDGTIEASTIVNSIESINGDRKKLLKLLGYNDKEWELLTWRITIWDGGVGGKQKYSVKYKVKPLNEPSVTDFTKAIIDTIKNEVKPVKLSEPKFTEDYRRLMEIPPVELHLGKIGSIATTGEDYNVEIAKRRFYEIFERIYEKQKKERCERCLLVIGSDFFNSESDNATSTHKIPQQNCSHYIDLFVDGLKMYTRVILQLRERFPHVDVMLCAGNHARAMEFFLYVALQQAFLNDKIVTFSNNYQETQYYEFGNSVIFFNHGDVDIKRTMQSIPAEFSSIWGKYKYRELHLGHLHKEVVVDDELGMVTRRIGSPCGTDMWHKLNRWVGATKKHQVFIWDNMYGLSDIYYIPTRIK